MGQAKLKRHEDWPLRLSRFVSERRTLPFVWGENDCMLFGGDCINALTGVDYTREFKGTYVDAEGAKGIINSSFDGSITNIINHFLGDQRPHPLINQRGDLVVADIGGIACCGVIDDTGRRVAFLTENGLVFLPLKDNMMVWGYG